jgi:catalase
MAASRDVRRRTGHEARHPDHRGLTELGRLEVTAIFPTSAADEHGLVFDPTNRTDGIDLSADPILLVRSAAYSISYDYRRKGGSD